jgi:hypothetical protein
MNKNEQTNYGTVGRKHCLNPSKTNQLRALIFDLD